MLFQTTPTLCTLTLSRAELAAMLTVASKDAARYNLFGIKLDAVARVAVSTDGHRLLVAAAGPAPFDPGPPVSYANAEERKRGEEYREAARLKYEAALAEEAAASASTDRSILVGREDAEAWAKACGSKARLRITWGPNADTGILELAACVVDQLDREGAKFTAKPITGGFPPWRAVIPEAPTKGIAPWIAVNASYLADAMGVLAKVSSSKACGVYIWPPSANDEKAKTDGSLEPMVISMDDTGGDGVAMKWRYVLMPMRADAPAVPWRSGVAKVDDTDQATTEAQPVAAAEVLPIGKRKRSA